MWTALDAEFYLAFDAGREDCIDLVVSDGGGTMLLLPTAYQEIADLCVQTQDEELQAHALDALRYMTVNGVLQAPTVDGNVGTDKELADELIRRGLFSEEQRNSALILAETACLEMISCVLTLDPDIINADHAAIMRIVEERHLSRFDIKTVSSSAQ